MAKLDLQWLDVFVEIYRTQSVSRAAQALGMEQASASVILGKLRRHFGDPLFTRTASGMEATPRAQRIYPDLVEALARVASARAPEAAFAPESAQRVFRISMTDISELVLLPTLINHLQASGRGLRVEAQAISPHVQRQLEGGDLDLAIGFIPSLSGGFFQQALFAQDFVCLAARGHPRLQGALDAARFSEEFHVVVNQSGTGHGIVEQTLRKHGLSRRVALRVPSFLAVARIVAGTELIATVPRLLGHALATQEAVQLWEPPVPLPAYKVRQHWHERFNGDAGNVWLRQAMVQLFAGYGQRGQVSGLSA